MKSLPFFEELLDDLCTNGFAYRENFFSKDFCQNIIQSIDNISFKEAKIGNKANEILKSEIRSDLIHWIDDDSPTILNEYVHLLKNYQQVLNQNLFLNIKKFEGHLAKYPTGSYYKKHLDQHQTSRARVITTILYLNSAPDQNSGGEIRLYKKDQPELIECDIPPRAGAFLTFMSSEIYHEVLTSHFERYSLTGWFRNDI